MIDDGQRQACFEFGERQAGARSRRVAIPVGNRSAGRSISRRDHRIELAQNTFDHAALMDPAAVAGIPIVMPEPSQPR